MVLSYYLIEVNIYIYIYSHENLSQISLLVVPFLLVVLLLALSNVRIDWSRPSPSQYRILQILCEKKITLDKIVANFKIDLFRNSLRSI